MLLYHYTTRAAVDQIQASGVLKTSRGAMYVPPWLSLTQDPDPSGHGLADGSQITADQAAQIAHVVRDGIYYSIDYTECRVLVDLDEDDSKLIRVNEHHSIHELCDLNVSAHLSNYMKVSIDQKHDVGIKIMAGLLTAKSGLWWYYKSPIPLERLQGFEQRDHSGLYQSMAL